MVLYACFIRSLNRLYISFRLARTSSSTFRRFSLASWIAKVERLGKLLAVVLVQQGEAFIGWLDYTPIQQKIKPYPEYNNIVGCLIQYVLLFCLHIE